jgi:FkbM family methyltransferase
MTEFLPKTQLDHVYDENILEKVTLRNKTINYIKNDNCISQNLKSGSYWEEWMFEYIQQNYTKNTNILDLGGHIGTTTLLMSEVLSHNCKIFTFEPIYSNILLKNIVDNNLTNNVVIYPYGVGNKIENLNIKPINLSDNINFGAVSIVPNLNDTRRMDMVDRAIAAGEIEACDMYHEFVAKHKADYSCKINIVPVDYFNFENISLIKIDVEHMEIEVLEGCLDLIKRCKPSILIETYKLNELKQTHIFKELLSLGYEINIIPEGYYDYIMKINT